MASYSVVVEHLDEELVVIGAQLFRLGIPHLPGRVQVVLDDLALIDQYLLAILGVFIVLPERVRFREPVHIQ